MTRRKRPLRDHALGVLVACWGAVACDGSTDSPGASPPNEVDSGIPMPDVSGPISGGRVGLPFNSMPEGLAERFDYTEQEFFIAGTARAFQPQGSWTGDGHWAAEPAATAPYQSRVLVRRPRDPAKFNGTVLVEWLNVSAGMDADPDFGQAHMELLRSGYAYVGVSAQAAGIMGGGGLIPIPGLEIRALRDWDPERYSTLEHPGDDYSYDIYNQVAEAILRPRGVAPLSGLSAKRLIATGESQSAGRMVSYVNAIHPVARIYHGFLIHSRGGGGAPVSSSGGTTQPPITTIRTDLAEPVLQFQTETDLFLLGSFPARQPDTDRIRTWEVAGTSHADKTTLDYGFASGLRTDPGTPGLDQLAASCGQVNDGPQRYVLQKAISALNAWVAEGQPPSAGPLFEVAGGAIARDEHGNAVGGIRTPAVDVPISTLSGISSGGGGIFCAIFGTTTPFDPAKLAQLYPSKQDYVGKVAAAAQQAVGLGHLLPVDQTIMVQAAEAAPVPR